VPSSIGLSISAQATLDRGLDCGACVKCDSRQRCIGGRASSGITLGLGRIQLERGCGLDSRTPHVIVPRFSGTFATGAMMCQQWFSIAGLGFDVAGFLLIAFEWRHMFLEERRRLLHDFGHDKKRSQAEHAGNAYEDPRSTEYVRWREAQESFFVEWRMRGKIFYGGVVLVLFRFFFQVL
jgi:hypothetical protein